MQRPSMASCPACEQLNPPQANFCHACGSPLVIRCPACTAINVRTRQACHRCGAALAAAPSAADDGPVVPLLPIDPPDVEAAQAGWSLSLRSVTLTPLPDLPPLAAEGGGPPAALADPDAPGRPAPAAVPDPLRPTADLAALKAERRAKVRRARQAHAPVAPETPQDVLVLEPDAAARKLVCGVLGAFGFRTHVAVTVAEAEGLCARQVHVAVFLGLGADAEDAAALCRRLRDGGRRRPQAIVSMGDPTRHTDRVRMQLAGADAVLLRPVGRGDLARALDACGLALPRDPRRGTALAP